MHARELLWIDLVTSPQKASELGRCLVEKRFCVLFHAQAEFTHGAGGSSFASVYPNLEDRATGSFRSVDWSLRGISTACKLTLCLRVPGLAKGDRFVLFSSVTPDLYASLDIRKYAPDSSLRTIHQAVDVSNGHSVYLDWPWT